MSGLLRDPPPQLFPDMLCFSRFDAVLPGGSWVESAVFSLSTSAYFIFRQWKWFQTSCTHSLLLTARTFFSLWIREVMTEKENGTGERREQHKGEMVSGGGGVGCGGERGHPSWCELSSLARGQWFTSPNTHRRTKNMPLPHSGRYADFLYAFLSVQQSFAVTCDLKNVGCTVWARRQRR